MSLSSMQIQQLLDENATHECAGVGPDKVCVRIAAIGELPTRFGDFHIVAFENNRDSKEHVAIVRGDVLNAENVPVRLHSECLTGDAIGSLRCDCRDQLEASLMRLGQIERGVLLYMRQEGRGIGLVNKIRAYGLQDQGYDTVQANLALGFRDDEREYSVAAHMLFSLKIRSIQLMTNNPRKIRDLTQNGVIVRGRIPVVTTPNVHNAFYLRTKAEKSGHYLEVHADLHQHEHTEMPLRQVVKVPQLLDVGQE
jgi:GTP cyclohydrolase II